MALFTPCSNHTKDKVRKIDLFSKEWCDQVFQDRNKNYGAYQLRASAGRRYLRAMTIVLLGLIFFVGFPIGVKLYFKYKLLSEAKDFSKEVPALSKLQARKEHEVKMVSAGRARPTHSTVSNAANQISEIVEHTDQEIIRGIKGAETLTAEDWIDEWQDLDTLHNTDQLDLPIEGPQLVKVDKVEELPIFPGGITGLMKWLDANIPYPQTCRNQKVKGTMEVRIIISENGVPGDAQVTQKLHPDLDKLVLAAMKRMPIWTPGKQNGTPCRVAVTLPIHFEPK